MRTPNPSPFKRPTLIASPVQIKLLEGNVQLHHETYNKGDVVTVEKHVAVSLVRAKKAESLNGLDPSRSANRYTVLEDEAKPITAPKQTAQPAAEEKAEGSDTPKVLSKKAAD